MVNLEYERYKECLKTPTHSRFGEEAQLEAIERVVFIEHLIHVTECINKEKDNHGDDWRHREVAT